MNKNKRTFLSMAVFLSVFFLSAIFYFPILPIFAVAPDTDTANEARNTTSDDNAELQSFSYAKDLAIITEDEQEIPTEAASDLDQMQEGNAIAGNTEEGDAAVSSGAAGMITDGSYETAADMPEKNTPDIENSTAGEIPVSDTKEPEAEETVKEPPALYADIGISIADNFVNIRKEPSADSEVLGKLYKDSAATILKIEGEWFLVESGSVTGYIKSEFLKTGIPDEEIIKKYGESKIVVAVDGLNVRKEADTDAPRVDVVYKDEIYPILEEDDTWVKINVEDDKTKGYVMREYVRFTVKFEEAVSKEEEQELLRLQAEEQAKKETEIKQQEGVSYTKDELKLLACLVHAEAGSQNYEGKLAVANVVLNRIKSSKYPDTMKAVIYQPGQFTVADSGSLQKQLDNYENYDSQSQLLSIKAAKQALQGSNNIGSRLYFHSYQTAVNKGYDDKDTAVKIGGQLFW